MARATLTHPVQGVSEPRQGHQPHRTAIGEMLAVLAHVSPEKALVAQRLDSIRRGKA